MRNIRIKPIEQHLWELVVNSIKAGADNIFIALHILKSKDLIFIKVSDNAKSNLPIKLKKGHGLYKFVKVCEGFGGFCDIKQTDEGTDVSGRMCLSLFGEIDLSEVEKDLRAMVLSNLSVKFAIEIKTDDGVNLYQL